MSLRYSAPLAMATLLSALVLVTNANAGVPNALNSVVPTVIAASPDGTIVTDILVRDVAVNPVAGAQVTLNFSACSQLNVCPTACTGCTVDPTTHTVSAFSNAAGHAVFGLHMGASGCPNQFDALRVYADGVLIGSPSFASLDQNGDLSVTSTDVAMVQSLVGTTDVRADFNGDFAVTASDVATVQAHLGVTCTGPTPTHKDTWGLLKSIYR